MNEFVPVFEQGKGLLALYLLNGGSGYTEVVTTVERIDNRLKVYYNHYETQTFHEDAVECHIYFITMDAELLRGVDSIEAVRTTYIHPRN